MSDIASSSGGGEGVIAYRDSITMASRGESTLGFWQGETEGSLRAVCLELPSAVFCKPTEVPPSLDKSQLPHHKWLPCWD